MSDQLTDAMVRQRAPSLRNRDKEMIPRTMIRAMFGLALCALVIVSFAVITERDHVGQPKPADVVETRQIVIEARGPHAVRVMDSSGGVVADLDQGGFIAVVNNGLERVRLVRGVVGNPPVDLVAYENGRLQLYDPASGWSAELGSFGAQNKAAFERLMLQ